MRKEIAERWVAALRSGEYKQSKEELRGKDGFCCLGVLCDLYSKERGIPWVGDVAMHYATAWLPNEVSNWAGMKNRDGSTNSSHAGEPMTVGYARFVSLVHANDSDVEFGEIANLIENHQESL